MAGQIFESGRKILLKLAVVPAQAWIVTLVVLLLGARPAWAFIHRPAHLDQVIAECGPYGLFRRMMMVSDRTGDRLVYVQSTQNGMGIFVYDGATGRSQLLAETMTELAGQPFIGTPHLLPWSPDDKSFASYDMDSYADQEGTIDIFHTATGAMETIPCDSGRFIPTPSAPFGSWLTSSSFVYRNAAQEIRWIQKQADGGWKDSVLHVPSEGTGDLAYLTATSSDSIVWQQGSELWKLDVNSTNPAAKIFEAPDGKPDLAHITAVSYSPETGQFLLNCKRKKLESLWRITPDDSSAENPVLITSGAAIEEAQWIDGGNGYAYLGRNEKEKPILVVQTDSSSKPVRLFETGGVKAFTVSPNGKRLFILGAMSNEFAPALWKYDVDSASLQCIAPALDRPWQFSRSVPGNYKTFTTSSGKKQGFEIYLPPDFDREQNRRYPLVIVSDYTSIYGAALANCGILCAHLNQNNVPVEKWGNAVVEICHHLVADRAADPNRVFVVVSSAETSLVSEFCSRHPDLLQGIILLSPTELPDLPSLALNRHVPKMLINAGTADPLQEKGRRPTQYREDAARLGIRVDVVMREGARHEFMSNGARRQRLQVMADFIFDD